VAKKSVAEDPVVFVNPLARSSPALSKVRARRESLDFGGVEPMELATPAASRDDPASPLKKHKRESIGEAFSFTPTRK
jgi:hypothetical protein